MTAFAFAIIAVAMIAVALAWVVVPLVRQRRRGSIAREASNVAILRDQLKELEADLANGSLNQAQYDQARRELEQRVLEEAQPLDSGAPAKAQGGRRVAYAIAAVLPIAAIALYAAWGNFAAFSPATPTREDAQHALSPEQIDQMVAKLATRLAKEPDNVDGWIVLARSYYAMQRYPEAAKAFEHVVKLAPNDAGILADYADALAATQQSLQGKPEQLAKQALSIDRKNWKALALAGTAAFDRKDYKQAVAYWEEMKAAVPPEAPMAKSIDASIAEARQLGGMGPAAGGPSKASTSIDAAAAALPAAPGSKVDGTVSLSPKLAAQAKPDDVVFIFARPAEGSRVPLAIIKRQVKDLPAPFTLDESSAMNPSMTLSSVPQIVVGARISKSGNAVPQSGDLEGYSAPVKAGASGLAVVIDRTVP